MKNRLLILMTVMVAFSGFAQNVPRSTVILEIGTGLGCTYCPGATRAADSLIALGKSVAVIEYHYADSLTNDASMNRLFYYFYEGIPVGHFDGALHSLGGEGCPNGNVFTTYLPLYEQRIAVPSPLIIGIAGTQSGNTWNLTFSVLKVGPIAATDLKLHLAVTENHVPSPPWPGSGGCMTENHYLERCMLPDHQGTPISFSSCDMQIVNLTFTKPAYWNTSQIELVAFVQDNTSKEILNGSKVMLTALPPPMSVDFSAGQTSGCAPFTTNFSPSCTGADSYKWTFQQGTPATSALPNPTVTYNTTGVHDAELIAWNSISGVGNFIKKPGYISSTTLPGLPGTPQGSSGLCINPPDNGYVTSGSSGATAFTWDLSPGSAGILNPLGNSCLVNFDNTWTGTALLKVRGENSCGTGNWSVPLTITVDDIPDAPAAPAGPVQPCMHAQNTAYSTTGTPGADSYSWELLPPGAGTILAQGFNCTINWGATFIGPAQLHVRAANHGCEGPWSPFLNITVVSGPAAYSVTGGGAWCAIGGSGVPVGLEDSETGYSYTLLLDGIPTPNVLSGTGVALSFGNQTSPGTYDVLAQTIPAGCDNLMNGNAIVVMDPQAPGTAAEPEGPQQVYTGATPSTNYYTAGGNYATDFQWELSPPEAGITAGSSHNTLVTWNAEYQGMAGLKVAGQNACGQGSFSTSLMIRVDVGVGTADPEAQNQIIVYPNPCGEYLLLGNLPPGSWEISALTIHGMKVLNQRYETTGDPVRIETSSWAPGVYDLLISRNETQRHFRVIRLN